MIAWGQASEARGEEQNKTEILKDFVSRGQVTLFSAERAAVGRVPLRQSKWSNTSLHEEMI